MRKNLLKQIMKRLLSKDPPTPMIKTAGPYIDPKLHIRSILHTDLQDLNHRVLDRDHLSSLHLVLNTDLQASMPRFLITDTQPHHRPREPTRDHVYPLPRTPSIEHQYSTPRANLLRARSDPRVPSPADILGL